MSMIRLTVLLMVLPLGASCVAAVAGDDEAAAAGERLRVEVMTFNIRYGTANDGENHWRHRRRHCIDIIGEYGGDFVGLQEAMDFQNRTIRDALKHYGVVGVGRDDGVSEGEFCTILYDRRRWVLDREETGTFWLSDTPHVVRSRSWGNTIPRIVTWARFTPRLGDEDARQRGIWVFNTHFDHRSSESRQQSALALARAVAGRSYSDEPVIVMGDLNAGESSDVVRFLAGEAAIDERKSPAKLIETYRAVHDGDEPAGTFNGFNFGMTGGSKIDYIFVDAAATVHEAAIIRDDREERYPSDHFPVTAVVSWPIGD